MSRSFLKLNEFAVIIHKLLRSDRDVNVGVSGFTGEGKSCFAFKLMTEYSRVSGIDGINRNITWSRDELIQWVEGKGEKKQGQLKEYSGINCDELFGMFYRRNWYEDDQKGLIALLNMCRDRHLFIIGNIPSMMDLDPAFNKRLRFWVYIPKRGIAWVFQQENNPFLQDVWNMRDNRKTFRKFQNPYRSSNYVGSIEYDDFTESEKEFYYSMRNSKRSMAIEDVKKKQQFSSKKIREQRNKLVGYIFENMEKAKLKDIAGLLGLSSTALMKIRDSINK